MNVSKRVKTITALVDRSKVYALKDALDLVKKTATAKFDESIDVAVNLGIDAKKSDQVVRGSVVLPRGTEAIYEFVEIKSGSSTLALEDDGGGPAGAVAFGLRGEARRDLPHQIVAHALEIAREHCPIVHDHIELVGTFGNRPIGLLGALQR